MNSLMTLSKRAVALIAGAAICLVFLITTVVPMALGGGTIKEVNTVGVGEHQAVVMDGAVSDAQDVIDHISQERSQLGFTDEEVAKLAQPAERSALTIPDAAELEKSIRAKYEAAEQAKLKEQQAKEAQAAASAAEAAKKAQEAKAAQEKAQAAAQKANETVAKAQVSDSGWQTVVASCYYDVGQPIATGGTLGANDLIIAHKTLPLGTKVQIEYNGRKVTATVLDRGPYVSGRDIDLAPGVQDALGLHDGVTSVKMRLVG